MYDENNPAVLPEIGITAEAPSRFNFGNIWNNWNAQNLYQAPYNVVKDFGSSVLNTTNQHTQLPTTDKLNNWSNLIQGVGSLWNSWQYNKLAKKNLNHQMDVFNKNYEITKNKINSQLEDRQRARVASNPNAYRSVDSYLNQYGVK